MAEVSATQLGFSWGSKPLLEGVNLRALSGSISAVIGPNGSGKSTLLGLLAGLLRPQTGSVSIGGKDPALLAARERARLLAFLPQRDGLESALTVLQVLLLSRYAQQGWWPFADTADFAAAESALLRVDLADFANRQVHQLSGGERQRLAIARALVRDPAVLLLDEPASALDLCHQLSTFRLLRSLAAEGRTLLLVSHDLNLPGDFADQVFVLAGGRIAAAGTPAEILRASVLEPLYGVALHEARSSARALPVLMPAASLVRGQSEQP
ncbi:MAG: ABC transporter ATP-binding protein [Planctomycetes bacterium]|nr:ABC transporter ATP-binding protein [Planctomycetota bacterium]